MVVNSSDFTNFYYFNILDFSVFKVSVLFEPFESNAGSESFDKLSLMISSLNTLFFFSLSFFNPLSLDSDFMLFICLGGFPCSIISEFALSLFSLSTVLAPDDTS